MPRTNKLLNNVLFCIPRLILFGIIMFSLAVTLIVSLDSLSIFRPSLNALRQSIVSWFGM